MMITNANKKSWKEEWKENQRAEKEARDAAQQANASTTEEAIIITDKGSDKEV